MSLKTVVYLMKFTNTETGAQFIEAHNNEYDSVDNHALTLCCEYKDVNPEYGHLKENWVMEKKMKVVEW